MGRHGLTFPRADQHFRRHQVGAQLPHGPAVKLLGGDGHAESVRPMLNLHLVALDPQRDGREGDC